MTPSGIQAGPALSLLEPVICLLRLPSTARVVSHAAFGLTNATTDNQRGKKGQSLSRPSDVLSPHRIRLTGENLLVCVHFYFTVNVYHFLFFSIRTVFFFFLSPEDEQCVRDLLGC